MVTTKKVEFYTSRYDKVFKTVFADINNTKFINAMFFSLFISQNTVVGENMILNVTLCKYVLILEKPKVKRR